MSDTTDYTHAHAINFARMWTANGSLSHHRWPFVRAIEARIRCNQCVKQSSAREKSHNKHKTRFTRMHLLHLSRLVSLLFLLGHFSSRPQCIITGQPSATVHSHISLVFFFSGWRRLHIFSGDEWKCNWWCVQQFRARKKEWEETHWFTHLARCFFFIGFVGHCVHWCYYACSAWRCITSLRWIKCNTQIRPQFLP